MGYNDDNSALSYEQLHRLGINDNPDVATQIGPLRVL